ncbi:DUF5615 family PIN-like protein [Nocardia sp. NEAU-G5]|uniref:DUF5615 family PIN-like protein n=1 Tax=Nocardia albiluteola TaxID=2842303 RepID=A0ABS6ATL7_9NOCA|nr:DUF5615 family PIN-like protein [Nocardia albiluteola]
MKFLIDAQLPPALARAITSEGHEAVHVRDVDLTSASDHAVWDEALLRGGSSSLADRCGDG